MQHNARILFRVPGQSGMFDFDEIRMMSLHPKKSIGVVEIMRRDHSREMGKMSVSAILSKFG